MFYHKIIATKLILFVSGSFILAQDIDKVVFVESEFKPLIENAEKMGVLPELSDTISPQPEINYNVLPSRIDAKYKIKPIKPAKLVGSPLDKLYNSRVRLGLGNYTTPLAEFSIQNLRSKEYAVGAYVYHKSSHTKLKLDNGHKVPAGYGINKASVHGKRFYDNFNIEGGIGLDAHKSRFYGYNTANFTDSLPSVDNRDIRQWYTQLKARAEIYSTASDSLALRYRLGLFADYFADDYTNSQNHVKLPGQVSFMIESFRLDINAQFDYFQSTLDTVRGQSDNIVQFRPILHKTGDMWKVFVGINTYFTSYGDPNLFPEAQLSFTVLEDALEAYFGITGNLEVNHFSKMAKENAFIRPGLYMKNTRHRLIGYGGIKGAIASNAGYRIDVRFDSMDDLYLFVNDTSSVLENQFVPVYDNAEKVIAGLELWYTPLSFLDFYMEYAYHNYSLETEAKPWHRALSELTFTTRYNYKEKIYANLDIIHLGNRYAKNFTNLNEPAELKPIWDVNLRLEYKYSNVLSGFINVHNLLSQQYDQWNQYPSQKINVMVGFSYKF